MDLHICTELVFFDIVMALLVMAFLVMALIIMNSMVMAYMVLAYGLYIYGLHSHGLHSCGLWPIYLRPDITCTYGSSSLFDQKPALGQVLPPPGHRAPMEPCDLISNQLAKSMHQKVGGRTSRAGKTATCRVKRCAAAVCGICDVGAATRDVLIALV